MPHHNNTSEDNEESLVLSSDPAHPANLICSLCAHFYTLGWVTGTGGGMSILKDGLIYLAPTGVQKELMKPTDIFVISQEALCSFESHHNLPYLRRPRSLAPSACTPLFFSAFRLRQAGCCIHTHSQWAVLVTLLLEHSPTPDLFEIEKIEQIKGIPKGYGQVGNLGYHDILRIPVIENTAKEEDLRMSLQQAMADWEDTYAVLVRRHGIYVWGDTVAKAKTTCESLDYIFRLAVEMRHLNLPWIS